MNTKELMAEFSRIFPDDKDIPALYFAPGRVNLIGEHTDYNQGYVFPCALTFGTYACVRRNRLHRLRFASLNFPFRTEISPDRVMHKVEKEWINYPLGVYNQFLDAGIEFSGLDMLFYGTVPNGAGLSSSASIEMSTAVALNDIYQTGFSMVELAKMCQRAENLFVGMNCGIMDQFASGLGKEDAALFLNCESLQYESVPLYLGDYALVIANTNKRRGLTDSKYNERRAECEKAVHFLQTGKNISHLSQLDPEEFESLRSLIPDPVIARRARHVITENQRVLEAVTALKLNDLSTFGTLMNASHDSLQKDYEVTGKELDTMVEEARKLDGVLGSRMTGAGFGGCTLSLVAKEQTNLFLRQVKRGYEKRTGLQPEFYLPEIGGGAGKRSM